MSTEVEQIYTDVRALMIGLAEADKETDAAAWRRANIEADRYLMANKEVLLPIIVDALGSQIRGVRNLSDATEAQVAAARITTAEDTYAAFLHAQQEEANNKTPLVVRLFKQLFGTVELDTVQYATDTVSVIASPGCTVKAKDGRYGIVKHKYETGLLEVQGPDGLFAITEAELLIVIAPHNQGKQKGD